MYKVIIWYTYTFWKDSPIRLINKSILPCIISQYSWCKALSLMRWPHHCLASAWADSYLSSLSWCFPDSKYSPSIVEYLCPCLASKTTSYEHFSPCRHPLLLSVNTWTLTPLELLINLKFYPFGGNQITIYGDEVCEFYHECLIK